MMNPKRLLFPTFAALVLLVGCGGEYYDEDESPQGMGLGQDIEEEGRTTFASNRVCPASSAVKGIDVSKWQATVDWSKVKAAGIDFAIARVTYGTGQIDAYFEKNWAGMKSAGLIRGAYQYYRSKQSASAQANLVVKLVGKLGPGDLPVVFDVEDQSQYPTASQLRTWLQIVELGTGKRPIIYTSPGYWASLTGTSEFSKYPLWVAHYTTLCPRLPDPWKSYVIWQHTDKGKVAGVTGNVDMNIFNGSLAELRALADSGPIEPDACYYGGARGTCQSTSKACSGSWKGSLCPGPSSIMCCLPPAEDTDACSYGGAKGTCQPTSASCDGYFRSGLCPGPSSVKCCLPTPDYGACSYGGAKGACQSTGAACDGYFRSGLCSGPSSVKCCLPSSYGSCSYGGKQGVCQPTSGYCGGSYKSGLCPGTSSIKCCLP